MIILDVTNPQPRSARAKFSTQYFELQQCAHVKHRKTRDAIP
jgi:hypothetical protein